MNEFKILILPGELNNTPHNEDIVLLLTEEEFIKMWKRGQVLIRNRALKGQTVDADYQIGSTLS